MKRHLIGRIAAPAVIVALLLPAGYALASHPASTNGLGGFALGRSHQGKIAELKGFYDGHKDVYVNTDVSSRSQAKQAGINFSAAIGRTIPAGTAPMYFVAGPAAAHQLAVFGSEPGEKDYSPLWQEVVVRFKSGVKPVLLTSDNQTNALASKGKLTETFTKVVLNAAILRAAKKS